MQNLKMYPSNGISKSRYGHSFPSSFPLQLNEEEEEEDGESVTSPAPCACNLIKIDRNRETERESTLYRPRPFNWGFQIGLQKMSSVRPMSCQLECTTTDILCQNILLFSPASLLCLLITCGEGTTIKKFILPRLLRRRLHRRVISLEPEPPTMSFFRGFLAPEPKTLF